MMGQQWIWYVRNNGAEGDNWAANNVRTGGAGAMGWRISHSDDLREKLKHLEAVLDGAIEKEARERRLAAMADDTSAGRNLDY